MPKTILERSFLRRRRWQHIRELARCHDNVRSLVANVIHAGAAIENSQRSSVVFIPGGIVGMPEIMSNPYG